MIDMTTAMKLCIASSKNSAGSWLNLDILDINVLIYGKLYLWEHISIKLESKFSNFCTMKFIFCLQNDSYYVSASMG